MSQRSDYRRHLCRQQAEEGIQHGRAWRHQEETLGQGSPYKEVADSIAQIGLWLTVPSLGSPVTFGPLVHSYVLLANFAASTIATDNCKRIAGDVEFDAIDIVNSNSSYSLNVEALAQACTICQVRLLSACIEG